MNECHPSEVTWRPQSFGISSNIRTSPILFACLDEDINELGAKEFKSLYIKDPRNQPFRDEFKNRVSLFRKRNAINVDEINKKREFLRDLFCKKDYQTKKKSIVDDDLESSIARESDALLKLMKVETVYKEAQGICKTFKYSEAWVYSIFKYVLTNRLPRPTSSFKSELLNPARLPRPTPPDILSEQLSKGALLSMQSSLKSNPYRLIITISSTTTLKEFLEYFMVLISGGNKEWPVTKFQIERAGLNWKNVSQKLIENNWAEKINTTKLRLRDNWERKKDRMSKTFGDNFLRILPILRMSSRRNKGNLFKFISANSIPCRLISKSEDNIQIELFKNVRHSDIKKLWKKEKIEEHLLKMSSSWLRNKKGSSVLEESLSLADNKKLHPEFSYEDTIISPYEKIPFLLKQDLIENERLAVDALKSCKDLNSEQLNQLNEIYKKYRPRKNKFQLRKEAMLRQRNSRRNKL